MSLSFLQNIGLTETESSIYDLLLRLGEVPVSTVIRESKLKRPTVYKALKTLQKKGLVLERDIRKKIHVRPESPIKLQELAESEAKKINEAKNTLQALLPGMAMSFAHSTEKPIVRIYEGLDGLKELYLKTLSEGKSISAILQVTNMDPELHKWLNTTYIRKRKQLKIFVKSIVASSAASNQYVKQSPNEFRTAKIVDAELFPIKHEIDIYGDQVAIIHYIKDEPLIGIVIQHPNISLTMKAWFDLTWSGLV